jgi:hypothetical protein
MLNKIGQVVASIIMILLTRWVGSSSLKKANLIAWPIGVLDYKNQSFSDVLTLQADKPVFEVATNHQTILSPTQLNRVNRIIRPTCLNEAAKNHMSWDKTKFIDNRPMVYRDFADALEWWDSCVAWGCFAPLRDQNCWQSKALCLTKSPDTALIAASRNVAT